MSRAQLKFILALQAGAFLTGCAASQASAGGDLLRIGTVELTISGGCSVQVVGAAPDIGPRIEVDLPYPESCDFVRIPGTNVIRIERYYDAWVVLVESHKKIDEKEIDPRFGCDTQYKALIVRDDRKVMLNPKPKGGSGCPPVDREREAYVALAQGYVTRS